MCNRILCCSVTQNFNDEFNDELFIFFSGSKGHVGAEELRKAASAVCHSAKTDTASVTQTCFIFIGCLNSPPAWFQQKPTQPQTALQ